MNRFLKDALLLVTQSLPAAGADNASPSIDLGAALPWPTTENIQAELTVPALPNLANEKTAVFIFEDSDDGESFDPIAELAPLELEGATATPGSLGDVRSVYFPPSVRRHVRVACEVEADGGNSTSVEYSFGLVF